MATANTALNRPRGPALIPPQTPPGTTTQPPTHATFCAPLFIIQIDGETTCGQGRNKAEENRLMEKRPADKGRNIVCSSVTTKTS